MCGITGIYTLNPNGSEPDIVRRMCDTIVHRGPDDDGFYSDGNMSLGMRRLSIIDLEGGKQPIYNEDESIVIILNGEVYNYIELRSELTSRGHTFKTNSDVEVVVHLYEEKGIELLGDLNGMFAFCLWDKKNRKGFIARDRLGIKPLYYWSDNHSIAFASELKALKERFAGDDINSIAVMAYLQYMFIPAPLTPYSNIKKMMPASYIQFSTEGISEPVEYWKVPENLNHNSQDADIASEFKEHLKESIKLRLRSDVPVGIFLSGGIDSSLVAAFAMAQMGPGVSSFYVDYEGTHFDEKPYAELMALHLGCSHHNITVSTEDVIKLLPKIIWHMDEPHADSAIMGTFVVSQLASEYVKVVLNGTGGDELFAGYKRYARAKRINKWLRFAPEKSRKPFLSMLRTLGVRHPVVTRHDYFGTFVCDNAQTGSMAGFFTDDTRLDVPHKVFPSVTQSMQMDDINKLLYTDVKFYLTDDLLLILDKLTMAVSIEGRVPLLDHKLTEWAFQISGESKIQDGISKFLLKKWLKDILPEEILNRRKMGFGAPVDIWMKNGLFEESCRLVDNRPKTRDSLYWGLRGDRLMKKMSSLNSQACFKLLCLELWYRINIDGMDDHSLSVSEIGQV